MPTLRPLFLSSMAALFAVPVLTSAGSSALDLSGRWRFALDREDRGVQARWFATELAGTALLPGSLAGQGIGDRITLETKWTGGIIDRSYFTSPDYAPYRRPDNIKIPFWLQPETHYVGAAWFQRDIHVPADWAGRRLELFLERPHWHTAAWLDDRPLGSGDSLSVPHTYDLGDAVPPGRHVLTLRIDNTPVPDLGENSHSISDHTQGNWNGVVGRIELRATAPAWIDDLQVYPRVADRTAIVRGHVAAEPGTAKPRAVRIAAGPADAGRLPAREAAVDDAGDFSLEYPLGADTPAWDEFSPALQRLEATLPGGEMRTVTFGFRELGHRDGRLTLNGRPLLLRGTLECAAFPRTGHPPLDVDAWKHEFVVIRAHGLNHVRFHSWCPPEAAFTAADELGMYLQIEAASWPNQSTTLGDGQPVDAWLEAESLRILRAYGNHPSFTFFCAGNEPGGDHYQAWLTGWLQRRHATDPRRLYCAGAGWPILPGNDYEITPEPRIQHWGEGLASRINRTPPETRTDYRAFVAAQTAPVVSHEIGQWCAYPDFSTLDRYTGYLKPRNFEIFRASLAAHGMAAQAHDFLIASGQLQALCYKEEIEAELRTPGLGGFQLLGLSDFPGQGTALVGVLDAFWEEKGYISAADFRRFCGPTVPLARLARRVFTTADTLEADLEVAHFGPAALRGVAPQWRLLDDHQRPVAAGSLPPRDIPLGNGNALGRVSVPLHDVPAPARYRLEVSLAGTAVNDWAVWVYPTAPVASAATGDVLIAREFDAGVRARLAAGGRVVLMIPSAHVAPDPRRGRIALGFSSIFWNTAWTEGQAPHTLGVLCDPGHPALAAFPTEKWSDWQWWYPISHAAPMLLEAAPRDLQPIIQVIDDWFTNRRLALAFEVRVGPGRLLVTSIDLDSAELDPVRRQLRASLLRYVQSHDFRPRVAWTEDGVQHLISSTSPAP